MKKTLSYISLCFIVSAAFLLIGSTKIFAGTCTWTGDTNANWNNSANWTGTCSGAGIPDDGDDLIFPAEGANRTMTNNITDLIAQTLQFSGADYTLSGNSLSINDSILVGVNFSATINTNLTLTDNALFSTLDDLDINGDVDLNGFQLNLDSGFAIQLLGTITGNGDIVVVNNQRLHLGGENDFTGDIILETYQSNIYFGSSNSAGNDANVISSTNNATYIGFDGNNITLDNDIQLMDTGFIINFGTGNVLNGDIVIDDHIGMSLGAGNLIVNGVISGDGTFRVEGTNSMTLAGSSSNTFTGSFEVFEGSVYLDKSASAIAISAADILIGNGTGAVESAALVLNNSNQINNASIIEIDDDGVFDLNGMDEWIGQLTGNADGLVVIPTGSQLVLVQTAASQYGGFFEGAGELTKIGASTFTMVTNSTGFTGNISVSEGAFILNGSINNGTVYVNGGTLGGFGSSGTVTALDGGISPGNILGNPGVLNVNGNLLLNPLQTIYIQLNGEEVFSEYDQISVSGDINLDDAILNLSLGYTPIPGTSYTIMEADGTIEGQFVGLPNYSTIDVGGVEFIIVYSEHKVELMIPAELYLNSFTSTKTLAVFGNPITLNVKWTSNGPTPTGTTSFKEGSTNLGTVALVNGEASLTLSNLSIGTHDLYVEYSGDSTFGGAYGGNVTIKITAYVGSYSNNVVPVSEESTVEDLELLMVQTGPVSFPSSYAVDSETNEVEVQSNSNESSSSNNQNISPIFVGIIVLSILGIGGYYYYQVRFGSK